MGFNDLTDDATDHSGNIIELTGGFRGWSCLTRG